MGHTELAEEPRRITTHSCCSYSICFFTISRCPITCTTTTAWRRRVFHLCAHICSSVSSVCNGLGRETSIYCAYMYVLYMHVYKEDGSRGGFHPPCTFIHHITLLCSGWHPKKRLHIHGMCMRFLVAMPLID